IKEYEPLSVAIAVPLTLDADPDLVDGEGADYQAAWDKALGPGSRIDRILTATTDETVTWAIDPALVGLPAQPRGSVDRRAPDTQTSAA
ncbi:hypothetical protein, partial [Streptomyces caniscabiei]|uniref:hypothetical protein n=1 Tax=Streptomyces caniscabiei TaxID=2746961 RepID=UPI0038F6476A